MVHKLPSRGSLGSSSFSKYGQIEDHFGDLRVLTGFIEADFAFHAVARDGSLAVEDALGVFVLFGKDSSAAIAHQVAQRAVFLEGRFDIGNIPFQRLGLFRVRLHHLLKLFGRQRLLGRDHDDARLIEALPPQRHNVGIHRRSPLHTEAGFS